MSELDEAAERVSARADSVGDWLAAQGIDGRDFAELRGLAISAAIAHANEDSLTTMLGGAFVSGYMQGFALATMRWERAE